MSELRYTEDHEWVRIDDDGNAVVGITDYAQEQLGEIVFIELPEVGDEVERGAEAAVIESVKAASELFAPVSGTVVKVNEALNDEPALVQRGPDRRRLVRGDRDGRRRFAGGAHDRGRVSRVRGGPRMMEATGDDRLGDVTESAPFVRRHIGPDESEAKAMLDVLGFASVEDLVDAAAPAVIRHPRDFDLEPPLDEPGAYARLAALAGRNRVMTSLIGMGYHGTHTPAVIRRNVLENPAWYTAYTPYQSEVSQGRMEALLNYQQMVIDLTGMDLANASLLDEATAAAEAMAMARRVGKAESNLFLVDADCHPQTIDVVRTRAAPLDLTVEVRPAGELDGPCFGVLVQYPGSSGAIPDLAAVVARARAQQALVAVAADPLALVMLRSPGELGADIVVGSSQRFGVPMGCGGPHAAFFATRDAYRRSTPGRIIGVSVDRHGQPAFRMALQTREQHIRREKATSNICTAQVLLAVMAGFYAVYHGPEGLSRIARRVHRMALVLREGLASLGFETENETFFDTLTVKVPAVPAGEGEGGGRSRRGGRHPRAGAGAGDQPARGRPRADRDLGGRDHHSRDRRRGPGRVRPSRRGRTLRRIARRLGPPLPVLRDAPRGRHPRPPGLPPLPQRDRDAAVSPAARDPRHRPRPLDDPPRLVHDEAERDDRDAPGDVRGLRGRAPLRAPRPDRGVRAARPGPRADALRVHRVRGGVLPAERRVAGGVRGASRHPAVPREPGGRRTERLPHPRLRARHEPRERAHGGA